jgi:hypothetical protein
VNAYFVFTKYIATLGCVGERAFIVVPLSHSSSGMRSKEAVFIVPATNRVSQKRGCLAKLIICNGVKRKRYLLTYQTNVLFVQGQCTFTV